MNEYSTASTAGTFGATLKMEDLQKSIEILQAHFNDPDNPENKLKQWMRAKGFDPDLGDLMVLPESTREELGPFPPRFIRFSSYLGVLLVKGELVHLGVDF